MTEEELEKEADEYAKKDCPDNFLCTRSIAKRGYLAGAKSRDKRIAEAKELLQLFICADGIDNFIEVRDKAEQFLEENKE